MKQIVQEFLATLERKGFKHHDIIEDSENDMVIVPMGFQLENTMFTISVYFENDASHVALRCFDLLKVNDQQFAQAVLCCNDLNKNVRWVKFYVDPDDNKVSVEDDAIVNEGTAGEEIVELVLRMAAIADNAYPDLNRAIWA